MGALLEIALPYLLAFSVAVGLALVAHPVSKGFIGWLAEKFVNLPLIGALSLKQALRLNLWIANQISPHVAATGGRVALWFNGLGQASKYDHDLAYRQSLALANYGYWQSSIGAKETIAKAKAQARAAAQKNALTKAPPLPQRRITQHEADIRFQQIIGENFVSELKSKYPKFDWDKWKWLAFLGAGDIHGHSTVTAPPKPQLKPAPAKPQTVRPAVPIAPPQPTTLPRTDDKPTPDPGQTTVPGVVAAKDKWARGQIVKLRDYEKETRRHLGPLAFLALPAAGISTLIGLLECKNFGRFSRGICSIPTNLFSDLLGLLLDTLILADICDVVTLVQDAFSLVEGPLTDFIGDVGGALCHGDFDAPPVMQVPQVNLWTAPQIAL